MKTVCQPSLIMFHVFVHTHTEPQGNCAYKGDIAMRQPELLPTVHCKAKHITNFLYHKNHSNTLKYFLPKSSCSVIISVSGCFMYIYQFELHKDN